jgi:hypothetical protein
VSAGLTTSKPKGKYSLNNEYAEYSWTVVYRKWQTHISDNDGAWEFVRDGLLTKYHIPIKLSDYSSKHGFPTTRYGSADITYFQYKNHRM